MDRRWFNLAAGAMAGAWLVSAAAPLHAQRAGAVQLPTFRFFGISTTVEVPDGGSASLGGVNSSAQGRVERGIPGLGFRPFDNVATGSTTGARSMSVTATIHDFDAMDKQLLGEGGGQASAITAEESARRRLPLMLRYQAAPAGANQAAHPPSALAVDAAGGSSLAELRRQQSAEDAAINAEATQLVEQARQIAADGKPGVARIYYQMALRRATGPLKAEIAKAIGELGGEEKGRSVARHAD